MPRHVPGDWFRALLTATAALAVLVPLRGGAAPESAARLFLERCSTCHSVGEGDKVGPDLKGVTERREEAWIRRFVRGPGALIDSGDATANELLERFNGIRMPDQALSDTEFDGLLAFLKECSAKGSCKPAAAGPKLASDATPEEVEQGRQLFEGTLRLANGGPPCLGCHNVRGVGIAGGGTLASDLTFVYARLGEKGMVPALSSLAYPVMEPLYAQASLTEGEQYALKAFFWNASRDGSKPKRDRDFFYLGLGGMAAVLGLVGIVWGGRSRRSAE